ncbi:Hypothetical protein DPCES_0822, partial [Desulfitobacterium hafniense]
MRIMGYNGQHMPKKQTFALPYLNSLNEAFYEDSIRGELICLVRNSMKKRDIQR